MERNIRYKRDEVMPYFLHMLSSIGGTNGGHLLSSIWHSQYAIC